MIRKIIHIDKEKCNGCGLCASACHEGAIGLVDGKAMEAPPRESILLAKMATVFASNAFLANPTINNLRPLEKSESRSFCSYCSFCQCCISSQ